MNSLGYDLLELQAQLATYSFGIVPFLSSDVVPRLRLESAIRSFGSQIF